MVFCDTCKKEIKDITEAYFELLIYCWPHGGNDSNNRMHIVHSPMIGNYKWLGGDGDCRRYTLMHEDWRAINEGRIAVNNTDPNNPLKATVPKVLSADNGGWADGEYDDKIVWVGDPVTKIVARNALGFITPVHINGYVVDDKYLFECYSLPDWEVFEEQLKEFGIPTERELLIK